MNNHQKLSDNKVVTPSVSVSEKISQAQKVAEAQKNHPTFVSAIFKTIFLQDLAMVSIPATKAKYMNPVKGHDIMVFSDESLRYLNTISVRNHYVHGDFVVRKENGIVKPSVIRHFCVTEKSLGKIIAAKVEIKEKKCLITNEKTIVIDISELLPGTYLVKHQMKLGAEVTGKLDEVKIPGTDRCIRFDEIKTQLFKCSAEEDAPEKKANDDNFVIEEAKTERRHRLSFKPVEKIEINQPLQLKKKETKPGVFEILRETPQGLKKAFKLMHN